jgi:ppGpp synthetase/RelA/SpoT-type nucleotidyltranferase
VWLQLASDPDRLRELCSAAIGELGPVVRAANQGQCCFCYGGAKPKASIDKRVRQCAAGAGGRDFWDLSRCRVVVEGVRAVFRTSEAIAAAWKSRVVRYRDYYRSPRGGWQDPYRAVHMELLLGNAEAGEFVEVQVLTIARDAIGMLDHTIMRCRAVEPATARHVEWLRGLSRAGNILDAGFDE